MKHCITCGSVVPQGHGKKSKQKYCTYECYTRRNVPQRDKLLSELNRTDNITVTAQLFGTNKQALYSWMKMLGIKRQVQYV